MTTPNEELIDALADAYASRLTFSERRKARAALEQALQSQAERIKALESFRQLAVDHANVQAREALNYQKTISDLRAQLDEIEKTEPVAYQAKSRPGFISCSPYTWEDCTPEQFAAYQGVIETRKLFTRPMPADVTELVELLEFMWRDVPMNEYAFEKLEAALSKYKEAK